MRCRDTRDGLLLCYFRTIYAIHKDLSKSKFDIGSYTLRVRRSRTGLGLYTASPILKGKCVVEYTGRFITAKEEYTSRSKYLFEVTKKKTLDGSTKSNMARYINHSCRPNCEIEIWRGHVYVMARRFIRAGEELAYDYDSEYFNTHIKPKGCKCGKCSPE